MIRPRRQLMYFFVIAAIVGLIPQNSSGRDGAKAQRPNIIFVFSHKNALGTMSESVVWICQC